MCETLCSRAFSSQTHPAGRAASEPDRNRRQRRGVRVSSVQRPAAAHPVAQTHHGQRQQRGTGRTPVRPRPQGLCEHVTVCMKT